MFTMYACLTAHLCFRNKSRKIEFLMAPVLWKKECQNIRMAISFSPTSQNKMDIKILNKVVSVPTIIVSMPDLNRHVCQCQSALKSTSQHIFWSMIPSHIDNSTLTKERNEIEKYKRY